MLRGGVSLLVNQQAMPEVYTFREGGQALHPATQPADKTARAC